jgi:fatty acid desaturase
MSGKKVQTLDEISHTDLKAVRNEYHFRTPFLVDVLSPLLKDQRDVPMLCLMLNIMEALLPGAILVYSICLWQPPWPLLVRNIVGLAYVVVILLGFQERFILMLHFSSHRSVFNNDALNGILNWGFAPFFGIPCGVYKLHHCIMHHIENNHALDTSSTECYQRDNWLDFLRYWFHFACLIWVELPYYTIKTRRWEQVKKVLSGLSIWLGSIVFLWRCVSPLGTFWVFVLPHIIAMTAMSFGNWSQHIFVDPKNPTSNYALTYNCIHCPGNQTTFNDGYHIIHHLNARLHWTELPDYFIKHKDQFRDNGAVTFTGLHFFDVGILVMTKQLRKLAEHYVHLGTKESAPTVEAVEERLRSLLEAMPATVQSVGKKAE